MPAHVSAVQGGNGSRPAHGLRGCAVLLSCGHRRGGVALPTCENVLQGAVVRRVRGRGRIPVLLGRRFGAGVPSAYLPDPHPFGPVLLLSGLYAPFEGEAPIPGREPCEQSATSGRRALRGMYARVPASVHSLGGAHRRLVLARDSRRAFLFAFWRGEYACGHRAVSRGRSACVPLQLRAVRLSVRLRRVLQPHRRGHDGVLLRSARRRGPVAGISFPAPCYAGGVPLHPCGR